MSVTLIGRFLMSILFNGELRLKRGDLYFKAVNVNKS